MKTLSQEPEIVTMANALRLGDGDAVENILKFCRNKIAGWLKEFAPPQSILDLERIVCDKLNLVIHEVWNDADLEAVIKTYVEEGDYVFATLTKDLDERTFATLIRRKSVNPKEAARYVAVIDCRGKKGPRSFFSRWHEIAHLLTLYKQMELPFHRSTIEKNPTEKLMDLIAGEVGFYGPLFEPVLEAEIRAAGKLTFGVAENVRSKFCTTASWHATLNASAARVNSPIIILEAAVGLKKSEMQAASSSKRVTKNPVPQLRVMSAASNAAARQSHFQIPKFMRVPKDSIIWKVVQETAGAPKIPAEAFEDLAWWESSDGGALPNTPVLVQAIRAGDHVLAIISPA